MSCLPILWRRRGLLLGITVGGLLLSALAALLLPNKYEAVARLSALGLGSSSARFIGILQSRTLEDRIITKFDLKRLYGDNVWEDARKDLTKNSDFSEGKGPIIVVRVRDRSPNRAAAMAEDYAEELNRLLTQLNTTPAHRERVFLEQQILQVQQDLETDEWAFSKFASRNLIIDMESQPRRLIKSAQDTTAKLIDEQAELKSLESVYSAGNVQVRETKAKAREVRRELARLVGESNHMNSTAQGAPNGYPSMRQLPLLGTDYKDRDRSVAMENALFGTLSQAYQVAKLAELRDTPSILVLDHPEVPEKGYWPARLWIVLLSTAGSFGVGVAWILGAAGWAALDPEDPRKIFATEVVETTAGDLRFWCRVIRRVPEKPARQNA